MRQCAHFLRTPEVFRTVYELWAVRHACARYRNAGRCDTSGAIVAGGHQISFAQANHHRTAGPPVSLQVGLPFHLVTCHLGV